MIPVPITTTDLTTELVGHDDYAHYGRRAVADRVVGYAAAHLGTNPGQVPDTLDDDTAEAVRLAFYAYDSSDEPQTDDGEPLPPVAPQDRAKWDDARERARRHVREQTARLAKLRDEADAVERLRDQGIRTAILLGTKVADLAADANLKPPRIYQIRDSRR